MEDRFKFRVWCRTLKQFQYFQFDLKEGSSLPHSNWYNEKEPIQQSTGLRDKNGKLIYEGDIVKLPTQCNKELHGSYSLQEIVWRNGNWVLSYISSEKGCKLPRGWSACFLHDQWSDEYEKEFIFTNADIFQTYNMLEIIGNIYENKELLGEQK